MNHFFDTRIALLNAEASPATVEMEFQVKGGATLTHAFSLGARQRATIDVASLGSQNPALAGLADAEFSTVVRSDLPLVADRTMTWDSRGYGSHAESSIAAPASTWYLAEGATIGDFDLYYLVQNPEPDALDTVEVTYLLPPPARADRADVLHRREHAVQHPRSTPSLAWRTPRCPRVIRRRPTSRSSSSARCT